MCDGEALERYRAETVPVFPPLSHTHLLLLLLLLFLLHAHHHTHSQLPAPWKTLTSAPVCRDHSYEKRKGGKTRDGEEKKKKKKKHIRGSLPVAAQHAPSPPQSRQSSGASLTHRPRANTHKPVLHRGSDGLVFEINSRKMKRQQKRCRVESEITARRRQTQAKAMWVGVVGEMSRDTAIDTVTMWTEPQDTSRYEQPISSQGLESSQHRK